MFEIQQSELESLRAEIFAKLSTYPPELQSASISIVKCSTLEEAALSMATQILEKKRATDFMNWIDATLTPANR